MPRTATKAKKRGRPVGSTRPSSVTTFIAQSPMESPYKVDSDVPLTSLRSYNAIAKYPFQQMRVGDSFLIPKNDKNAKEPNGIHYAAHQFAKANPGFTVTTRQLLDKSRRVWRLK